MFDSSSSGHLPGKHHRKRQRPSGSWRKLVIPPRGTDPSGRTTPESQAKPVDNAGKESLSDLSAWLKVKEEMLLSRGKKQKTRRMSPLPARSSSPLHEQLDALSPKSEKRTLQELSSSLGKLSKLKMKLRGKLREAREKRMKSASARRKSKSTKPRLRKKRRLSRSETTSVVREKQSYYRYLKHKLNSIEIPGHEEALNELKSGFEQLDQSDGLAFRDQARVLSEMSADLLSHAARGSEAHTLLLSFQEGFHLVALPSESLSSAEQSEMLQLLMISAQMIEVPAALQDDFDAIQDSISNLQAHSKMDDFQPLCEQLRDRIEELKEILNVFSGFEPTVELLEDLRHSVLDISQQPRSNMMKSFHSFFSKNDIMKSMLRMSKAKGLLAEIDVSYTEEEKAEIKTSVQEWRKKREALQDAYDRITDQKSAELYLRMQAQRAKERAHAILTKQHGLDFFKRNELLNVTEGNGLQKAFSGIAAFFKGGEGWKKLGQSIKELYTTLPTYKPRLGFVVTPKFRPLKIPMGKKQLFSLKNEKHIARELREYNAAVDLDNERLADIKQNARSNIETIDNLLLDTTVRRNKSLRQSLIAAREQCEACESMPELRPLDSLKASEENSQIWDDNAAVRKTQRTQIAKLRRVKDSINTTLGLMNFGTGCIRGLQVIAIPLAGIGLGASIAATAGAAAPILAAIGGGALAISLTTAGATLIKKGADIYFVAQELQESKDASSKRLEQALMLVDERVQDKLFGSDEEMRAVASAQLGLISLRDESLVPKQHSYKAGVAKGTLVEMSLGDSVTPILEQVLDPTGVKLMQTKLDQDDSLDALEHVFKHNVKQGFEGKALPAFVRCLDLLYVDELAHFANSEENQGSSLAKLARLEDARTAVALDQLGFAVTHEEKVAGEHSTAIKSFVASAAISTLTSALSAASSGVPVIDELVGAVTGETLARVEEGVEDSTSKRNSALLSKTELVGLRVRFHNAVEKVLTQQLRSKAPKERLRLVKKRLFSELIQLHKNGRLSKAGFVTIVDDAQLASSRTVKEFQIRFKQLRDAFVS